MAFGVFINRKLGRLITAAIFVLLVSAHVPVHGETRDSHPLTLSAEQNNPLVLQRKYFPDETVPMEPERSLILTLALFAGLAVISLAAVYAWNRSRKKYRHILDSSGDAIFIHDMDGNMIEVNETACRRYGYSRQEFLKMTPADIDVEVYSKLLKIRDKIDSIGGLLFEAEHRKKDGSRIFVEVNSRRIRFDGRPCILSLVRDITERKERENALREAEARYREVFENNPACCFMFDRRGVILEWNRACEALYGWPAEKAVGRSMFELFVQEKNIEKTEENIKAVFQGRTLEKMEFEDLRADGSRCRVVAGEYPVRDKNGRVICGLCAEIDITHLRKAEEDQQKLQEQLFHSQKMESVGRLAGGIAHDFNNMLGVILGRAELALEETGPDSPVRKDLMQIMNAAQRSAELTKQLLAYARKQSAMPVVLDLNKTISRMQDILSRLIGEDVELVWTPGDGLFNIRMDPSQVDQVVTNLCINARDAIPGTGRIEIATANVVIDESYCKDHAGFAPGEYVMLAISDDGCGMDKEILGKIFEPFFTTKDVGEGTGMGLSTVYGIVKQNRGFINVYSEPGLGSTFKIYLPRCHEDAEEKIQAEGLPAVRGKGTVLVVEDEESILELSKIVLERSGYTVFTARTPADALKLAGEQGGSVDLLVTDVVMPGMNGKELAEGMKRLNPGIKIIFMSGYTANIIMKKGILEEKINFLQKPFTATGLVAKVREILSD